MEYFTPLKLSINEASTPSKTSPGSDARDQSNTISRFLGWRNTVPYHDCKGHQTIHYWALRRYLEKLVQQGLLKEYILTLEEASE